MRHIPPGLLFFLLLHLALTGCDGSGDNQPASRTISNQIQQKQKPIDLTISTEMVESLNKREKDFLAPVVIPSTSFKSTKQESKLNLSGKVHIDDEEEDYIDAIDGGEVNVEIKFK